MTNLDRSSGIPVSRQIFFLIAGAIRAGTIPNQSFLPGSRTLARRLGVSRNTIVTAYEELAARDLISGEPGSGMRVNGHAHPTQSRLWMTEIVRGTHYPVTVASLTDPDGNCLYLNF